MERFAVCVNDADEARRVLTPLLATAAGPTRCLMVMCPPRLGRRISRWLSAAERQRWADDWAARLQATLAPQLASASSGAVIDWVTARGPLIPFMRNLRQQHGAGLRLLDARQARLGAVAEPMTAEQASAAGRLAAPVAVASSLSLMLALTD